MTFSMVLMGWGGASGFTPIASVQCIILTNKKSQSLQTHFSGMFLFVGPVLLTLGTIFEWIMGNFLSMMIQALFCVFWLSFGLLQLPTLGLAAAYSPDGDAAQGAKAPEFNAVLAIYLLVWGFALFTFFILTLKTNLVFAMTFLLVSTASWVLSGAYWRTASGDYVMAGHLQTVSRPRAFPPQPKASCLPHF